MYQYIDPKTNSRAHTQKCPWSQLNDQPAQPAPTATPFLLIEKTHNLISVGISMIIYYERTECLRDSYNIRILMNVLFVLSYLGSGHTILRNMPKRASLSSHTFCCCLTLLYLNQEQPGLGRTKRLASKHRQLPPKQGHNQRRRITDPQETR